MSNTTNKELKSSINNFKCGNCNKFSIKLQITEKTNYVETIIYKCPFCKKQYQTIADVFRLKEEIANN